MSDTEKLKRVAERLGYKTYHNPDHAIQSVAIATGEPLRNWQEFNPYDNPAQLVECIEWTGNKGWLLFKGTSGHWYVDNAVDEEMGKGDTLAEAVINAIAGEDDEQS